MAPRTARSERAADHILPDSLRHDLGEEANALEASLQEPAPVSIRLNPAKPAAIGDEEVPWCAQGRYLNTRPVFTLDPLLHAGCYYVQEASSMLLERALQRTGLLDHTLLALDLCAAPGGKSTHIASLLTPDSLVVCNEVVPSRRPALMENVWKHGAPNTVITGSAADELHGLGAFFDLIVLDAPCSGEGMFRKDAFARQQWSEGLVRSCARTQRDLLARAWDALRPGGALIYSTCTWERSENEEQVERLLRAGGTLLPLELDAAWGVLTTDHGHRCYPHRVRGEGFFIAVVRKPGAWIERTRTPAPRTAATEVETWLTSALSVNVIEDVSTSYAVPRPWSALVLDLRRELNVLAPGIPVAERKGHAWRPHAGLALNALLEPAAFPVMDLDREGALAYLRGGTMNERDARGVRLARHEGHALGWLSGAGERWNNGWPKPWRIRMR